MIENMYNFADYSLGANDVDNSNTVDGKPIYYWVEEHDTQIPSDAGFVALIDSRNITVRDLLLTRNGQGVLLKNSTYCRIENVSVVGNQDCVYFDVNSTNNTIVNNSILNNAVTGVYLSASSSNIFFGNRVEGSSYGLYMTTASGECEGNQIFNNTIQRQWMGITLEGYSNHPVIGNMFESNVISNNSIGLSLYLSALNQIFHNNIVDNVVQIESNESMNMFDHLGEGNYWSTFDGADNDNDGIGDTPYVIDEQNSDNFPLAGFFSEFSAVWERSAFDLEAISNSTLHAMTFDQPQKSIAFNVEGSDAETSFCRITIPEKLLGGPYQVLLGNNQISILNEQTNGTHSFLYFRYVANNGRIEIRGETVIPEFAPILYAAFLTLTTSYAVLVKRRTRLLPK